eukprot:TRINITY_DN724_c0_g1_i1.p1 TRINITY_DN724_c0_g1~~TRINITY_DN724_c0_g1_i1.p1  ORF type:complete len:160 (-),score=51.95 TRINITY_DN724_c0_g1_i1:107-559(-)
MNPSRDTQVLLDERQYTFESPAGARQQDLFLAALYADHTLDIFSPEQFASNNNAYDLYLSPFRAYNFLYGAGIKLGLLILAVLLLVVAPFQGCAMAFFYFFLAVVRSIARPISYVLAEITGYSRVYALAQEYVRDRRREGEMKYRQALSI